MTHWHVLAGHAGCLPDQNEVFKHKSEGLEYLQNELDILDELNEKYEEIVNVDHWIMYTLREGMMYIQLEKCDESTCYDELS